MVLSGVAMLKPASLAMLGFLFAATIYAQNPKSTYVPAFKISVNPSVFPRDQSISATASFTAPTVCREQGLLLRLYDVDDTTGSLTYDSKYLEQTPAPYDPPPPAGTRVEITFDPFVVPAKASDKIYMVVWSWCLVRIPKGITPDGHIIWQEKISGTPIGGATFHFDCRNRTELCGYKPD